MADVGLACEGDEAPEFTLRAIRWVCAMANTLEDSVNDMGLGNCGKEPNSTTAFRAGVDIDIEDPFQKSGPVIGAFFNIVFGIVSLVTFV